MKVDVEISETTLENDAGYEVEGVQALCLRCEHTTESFGTHDASRRRCLVLLRLECPNEETNFYVEVEED